MASVRSTAYELQPLVRGRLARLGAVGDAWIERLPELVRELEDEWGMVVAAPLDGGTAAFVARARTSDGREAVVKLGIPDPGFARQTATIEAADGRGYVGLLAKDIRRRAMLQEALGPSLDRVGMSAEAAIDVLCRTLRRAWQAPSPPAATDPAEEKAHALALLIARVWHGLGRPCPERVVAQALEYAERRAAAFDVERCVVVHGDPHPGNALQVLRRRPGGESGFVFVDPDGFLADPAYDLGVVLRDWTAEIGSGGGAPLARRLCRRLASRTGVDETAIWEWGFVERVSTGLHVLELGAEELGRRYLDTAGMLA